MDRLSQNFITFIAPNLLTDMKKYLPLLLWVSVISCKKDNAEQVNAFTGNYKGTITLTEDSRTSRAGLQLMSILPSSNTHEIMMGGCVLFTSEARLDQNMLIIEKTKAAHGQG